MLMGCTWKPKCETKCDQLSEKWYNHIPFFIIPSYKNSLYIHVDNKVNHA